MKTAEDNKDRLPLYTIYRDPADFPGLYVMRASYPNADGSIDHDPVARTADTLEKVRAYLPEGLFNLGRQAQDDPKIVEVWI